MKQKIHIATLGLYSNEMIEYVLLRRGADKIILVYTEESEIQFFSIQQNLRKRGMDVLPCKVVPWQFDVTLAKILEEVTKHPESILEFHASCGTRVMTAALQVAALITESSVLFVEREMSGALGRIVEIEPAVIDKLTPRKRDILIGIQKLGGSVTQKELVKDLSVQRSGISKHLKGLVASGYVDSRAETRPKSYEISHLGRVILSSKQFRKMTVWAT